MLNTYKLMRSLDDRELKKLSHESLVELYQTTKDERTKNKIIATLFCSLFPMIMKIQAKFTQITYEDKVTVCMTYLLKSITKYKVGSKNKFSTLFYCIFNNKLKSFASSLLCNNRKIWTQLVDTNEKDLNYFLSSIVDREATKKYMDISASINDSTMLNVQEKLICNCYLNGYDKKEELFKVIDVSNMEYYYSNGFIKKVKEKKPKTIDDLKNAVLKASKQNIKRKLKENNYTFI